MGDSARLTVLGSGTAVPRADRGTCCYVVDDGAGTALLIDLGPGALQRAARAGYDLDTLSAILVTHVHPDHSADLVALQFALKNPIPRAGRGPLALYGHHALGLLRSRLQNAYPGWLDIGPRRLAFHPVEPGPVEIEGGIAVQAYRIAHHASSLGYRLTLADGTVVAFSGDAVEGGELIDLARDADLLVLEAAGPDGAPIPGHLTPRRAGAVAAEAGVRHLVLTHFYPPTLDEPIEVRARESFEGRVTLAEDGLILPLPG